MADQELLQRLLLQREAKKQSRDLTHERYARKAEAVFDQLLPMQRELATDRHKRLALLTPGKNGKTFTVRSRLVRRALLLRNQNMVYIGLSLPAAKRDIWRGASSIRHLCELLGLKVGTLDDANDPSFDVIISQQELTAFFPKTMSIIRVGGADNMDAIEKWRGGEGYDEVWIDEAKSHSAELLSTLIEDILEPRINWKNGVLGMCGTPGEYLEGFFYDVTRTGSEVSTPYGEDNEDELRWSLHRWSLEQNTIRLPGQTSSAWERALALKKSKGWTDQNPSWRREYLGQWCANDTDFCYRFRPYTDDGAEWNTWTPKPTSDNPFGLPRVVKLDGGAELPIKWQFTIGMDLGSVDPCALEVFAFAAETKRIYHVHEWYRQTLSIDLIAEQLSEAVRLVQCYTDYPVAIVADTAAMGQTVLSEVMMRCGHRVTPAAKADKFGFVGLVNDDLVDGRLRLLRGKELPKQMAELQWDESGKRENKKQRNDACDAALYARGAIIKYLSHSDPVADPVKTPEQAHLDALFDGMKRDRDLYEPGSGAYVPG